MQEEIKVSIVCNAYNHEKYIRTALDSFIMQKTSFAYEILVHDDASTDKTAEIIKEYELKYPDIVKPVYQTENQYSQKKGIIASYQIPRARGKYIALCEGDDYWTDPLKLQRQYDALEAHPEVDMCAHAAIKVSEDGRVVLQNIAPSDKDTVLPVEDVIMGEGGFVATNSLMYKIELYDNIPRFKKNFGLDYALQIQGSLRGGMLYLAECMSAYRYMSVGSWTSKQEQSDERRKLLFDRKQNMLRELDEDTGYRYTETVNKRMLFNEFEFYFRESNYKAAFDKKYKSVYMRNGLVGYIKLRLKSIFPSLNGIKQRWKMRGR